VVYNTSLRPWDGVHFDGDGMGCSSTRVLVLSERERERDGMNRTLPNLPALSRSIDDDKYNTSRKRKDPTSTGTQPPPPFPQQEPPPLFRPFPRGSPTFLLIDGNNCSLFVNFYIFMSLLILYYYFDDTCAYLISFSFVLVSFINT